MTTSIISRINSSPPPPALDAIIFSVFDPSVVHDITARNHEVITGHQSCDKTYIEPNQPIAQAEVKVHGSL